MSKVLPRICIIGAGAIGGYIGARLAQGFADVSVVARGRTFDALRQRGWVLEQAGSRVAAPVRAVTSTEGLGPQDAVIIAVKAYSLPQVAPLVTPLLDRHTVVLPAVNGVPWWFPRGVPALEPADRLASVDPNGLIEANIPFESILGTVVYAACSTPEPGVCRHHSGTRLVLGEPDEGSTGTQSSRLRDWVALLKSAGFDAITSEQIRTEVWRKLLGNACFNPVSLLTGTSTDHLIDDPRIHALFSTLMEETLAVGRAMGIDPGIAVAERIAMTRKLGHVKTSMLQDAEAGRPVEIEGILGAVVELAGRLGVATPATDQLYALARMRAKPLDPSPT